MGQEDKRFQPEGESSEAMLARMRNLLGLPTAPPRTDTYPLREVLAGLDLSTLNPSRSQVHQHETAPQSTSFPFPPGLNMIWRVAQSGANPNFVVQRPSADTEEKTTVLAVTSRLDYTNPHFSAPEAPDFQTAVQTLIPYILHRIPKPKNVSQQAFDQAIADIKSNLAVIAPLLTYSNDGQKDRFIAEENHQPISIALDHIALALSSLASSEKQMQNITRALQTDLLALH